MHDEDQEEVHIRRAENEKGGSGSASKEEKVGEKKSKGEKTARVIACVGNPHSSSISENQKKKGQEESCLGREQKNSL